MRNRWRDDIRQEREDPIPRRIGYMKGCNFIAGDAPNKQRTAVRNIGKSEGKHVDRRPIRGFRAQPDGEGWFTFDGKRFERVSVKAGVVNPFSLIRDPIFHQCPPVPDQDYSGVYLSDGVYFWLQMFQLERHLSWLLRTRYRINTSMRDSMIKEGVRIFVEKIRRERNINLNGPLSSMYTDQDELLIESDERVRDFVRRYGRDTRKLRN